MYIKTLLLLPYLLLLPVGSVSFNELNERQAMMLIDLYIDNMNQYCAENYNSDNYASLIGDIFDSPQTDVSSDIIGSQGTRLIIQRYLDKLKDSAMQIQYDQNYAISTCKYGSKTLWGCLLTKKLKYRWQSKPIVITEFIEIVENGTAYSIGSIHSNIVNPLEIDCKDDKKTIENNQSKLVALAESEVKNNQVELAALHYEQAKASGSATSPILDKKFKNVNTDSLFLEGIKKGMLIEQQGRYEEALNYFDNIHKTYTHISPTNANLIQAHIKKCKEEIRFEGLVSEGDFHFKNGIYDRSAKSYETALSIKQSNEVVAKRKQCDIKMEEIYIKNMKSEIERGEKLSLTPGKVGQGFALLIKYRYSDRLTGKQYFLMAQTLNSAWAIDKDILRAHRLTKKKDQCRVKREFMLKAQNMGHHSEHFDIMLNETFKNKDRRGCN